MARSSPCCRASPLVAGSRPQVGQARAARGAAWPEAVSVQIRSPPASRSASSWESSRWEQVDPAGRGPGELTSSLIGQSYVCSFTSNVPMLVTDPGSWIWAGSGVYAGDSLPGLVAPEDQPRQPGRAEPAPAPGHRPVPGELRRDPQLQRRHLLRGQQRRRGVRLRHRGLGLRPALSIGLPGARHRRPARRPGPLPANILRAFAAQQAGRAHPAQELIPGTGGRQPVLGNS